MKTLIKNALVIPMKNNGEYFRSDILIEGGKIRKIEKNIIDAADDVIDASNMIALPSFVDAHTHLSMVLMRNYKDDKKNLQDWLSEIFPIEDKLNDNDILTSSRLGIAELIKSGCTTFADMYFFAQATAKAVKEAGINASIGLTIVSDEESAVDRYENRYPLMTKEADGYDRIVFTVAPHAIYTTTKDGYIKCREYAEKENLKLHTHVSETIKEVEDCIKENGTTPLKYLSEIGALKENGTFIAHGVHLTDEELDICAQKGISVVNNPSSNMKLTSGALDTEKLLKKNINVALGTDGASSNNNLNMMKEINIAALSASLKAGVPIDAYEVLKMATINGAKALGLDYRIGTLEEGKDADLILLSTASVNMNPLNNVFSSIVYSSTSEDIKYVFSFGKKLLENRKLTYIDEKELIKDVNDSWNDILGR